MNASKILVKDRSLLLLQANGFAPNAPKKTGIMFDTDTFKPLKLDDNPRFKQFWAIALLSSCIRKQMQGGKMEFEAVEEKWAHVKKGVEITFIAIYAGGQKVFLTADAKIPKEGRIPVSRIANAILFGEEGSETFRMPHDVQRTVTTSYVTRHPSLDHALYRKIHGGFMIMTGEERYTKQDSYDWAFTGHSGIIREDMENNVYFSTTRMSRQSTRFENGKIIHPDSAREAEPVRWLLERRLGEFAEKKPQNAKLREELHTMQMDYYQTIARYALPVVMEMPDGKKLSFVI